MEQQAYEESKMTSVQSERSNENNFTLIDVADTNGSQDHKGSKQSATNSFREDETIEHRLKMLQDMTSSGSESRTHQLKSGPSTCSRGGSYTHEMQIVESLQDDGTLKDGSIEDSEKERMIRHVRSATTETYNHSEQICSDEDQPLSDQPLQQVIDSPDQPLQQQALEGQGPIANITPKTNEIHSTDRHYDFLEKIQEEESYGESDSQKMSSHKNQKRERGKGRINYGIVHEFDVIMEKTEEFCSQSGAPSENDFRDVQKMIEINESNSKQEMDRLRELQSYADQCYQTYDGSGRNSVQKIQIQTSSDKATSQGSNVNPQCQQEACLDIQNQKESLEIQNIDSQIQLSYDVKVVREKTDISHRSNNHSIYGANSGQANMGATFNTTTAGQLSFNLTNSQENSDTNMTQITQIALNHSDKNLMENGGPKIIIQDTQYGPVQESMNNTNTEPEDSFMTLKNLHNEGNVDRISPEFTPPPGTSQMQQMSSVQVNSSDRQSQRDKHITFQNSLTDFLMVEQKLRNQENEQNDAQIPHEFFSKRLSNHESQVTIGSKTNSEGNEDNLNPREFLNCSHPDIELNTFQNNANDVMKEQLIFQQLAHPQAKIKVAAKNKNSGQAQYLSFGGNFSLKSPSENTVVTLKSQKAANLFEDSMRVAMTDQSQQFEEQYRLSIQGSKQNNMACFDNNCQNTQEAVFLQNNLSRLNDRVNNSLGNTNIEMIEKLEEENFARVNDTQVVSGQLLDSKLSEQTQILFSGGTPLNDGLSLKTHEFFDLGQTAKVNEAIEQIHRTQLVFLERGYIEQDQANYIEVARYDTGQDHPYVKLVDILSDLTQQHTWLGQNVIELVDRCTEKDQQINQQQQLLHCVQSQQNEAYQQLQNYKQCSQKVNLTADELKQKHLREKTQLRQELAELEERLRKAQISQNEQIIKATTAKEESEYCKQQLHSARMEIEKYQSQKANMSKSFEMHNQSMEQLHVQVRDKDLKMRQLKNQLEHVREGYTAKINWLLNEKAKLEHELASRDSVHEQNEILRSLEGMIRDEQYSSIAHTQGQDVYQRQSSWNLLNQIGSQSTLRGSQELRVNAKQSQLSQPEANTSAGINSFALQRVDSKNLITGGFDLGLGQGSYDNRIAIGGERIVTTEGPSRNDSSPYTLPSLTIQGQQAPRQYYHPSADPSADPSTSNLNVTGMIYSSSEVTCKIDEGVADNVLSEPEIDHLASGPQSMRNRDEMNRDYERYINPRPVILSNSNNLMRMSSKNDPTSTTSNLQARTGGHTTVRSSNLKYSSSQNALSQPQIVQNQTRLEINLYGQRSSAGKDIEFSKPQHVTMSQIHDLSDEQQNSRHKSADQPYRRSKAQNGCNPNSSMNASSTGIAQYYLKNQSSQQALFCHQTDLMAEHMIVLKQNEQVIAQNKQREKESRKYFEDKILEQDQKVQELEGQLNLKLGQIESLEGQIRELNYSLLRHGEQIESELTQAQFQVHGSESQLRKQQEISNQRIKELESLNKKHELALNEKEEIINGLQKEYSRAQKRITEMQRENQELQKGNEHFQSAIIDELHSLNDTIVKNKQNRKMKQKQKEQEHKMINLLGLIQKGIVPPQEINEQDAENRQPNAQAECSIGDMSTLYGQQSTLEASLLQRASPLSTNQFAQSFQKIGNQVKNTGRFVNNSPIGYKNQILQPTVMSQTQPIVQNMNHSQVIPLNQRTQIYQQKQHSDNIQNFQGNTNLFQRTNSESNRFNNNQQIYQALRINQSQNQPQQQFQSMCETNQQVNRQHRSHSLNGPLLQNRRDTLNTYLSLNYGSNQKNHNQQLQYDTKQNDNNLQHFQTMQRPDIQNQRQNLHSQLNHTQYQLWQQQAKDYESQIQNRCSLRQPQYRSLSPKNIRNGIDTMSHLTVKRRAPVYQETNLPTQRGDLGVDLMGLIIDSMSHNSYKKNRIAKSIPVEERASFVQDTLRADEVRSQSHERELSRGSRNTRQAHQYGIYDQQTSVTNEANQTTMTEARFLKEEKFMKPELNSLYGQSKIGVRKPTLPPLNTAASPSNCNFTKRQPTSTTSQTLALNSANLRQHKEQNFQQNEPTHTLYQANHFSCTNLPINSLSCSVASPKSQDPQMTTMNSQFQSNFGKQQSLQGKQVNPHLALHNSSQNIIQVNDQNFLSGHTGIQDGQVPPKTQNPYADQFYHIDKSLKNTKQQSCPLRSARSFHKVVQNICAGHQQL